MNKTLLPIRVVFVALCAAAGWLVCYAVRDWDAYRGLATFIGLSIGLLVVLVDIFLKGFSLRGLSALSFGLGVGSLIAYLIGTSPLLEEGDPQVLFLIRLALFLVSTYLCTVIALRGKDEFNLVIPYVRFVPHDVEVPLVVLDGSALSDGRVAEVCEAGFVASALIVPRFVIQELQRMAELADPVGQARGRRGLETLAELRKIRGMDVRIHESEVAKRSEIDAKLVFLAQSMKARLLTTSFNQTKLAEFHGVPILSLHRLSHALRTVPRIGDALEVEVVKPGKEEGQGVGFLEDGSMVVVEGGRPHVGKTLSVEVTSVLPSAGGRMVFCRLAEDAS